MLNWFPGNENREEGEVSPGGLLQSWGGDWGIGCHNYLEWLVLYTFILRMQKSFYCDNTIEENYLVKLKSPDIKYFFHFTCGKLATFRLS